MSEEGRVGVLCHSSSLLDGDTSIGICMIEHLGNTYFEEPELAFEQLFVGLIFLRKDIIAQVSDLILACWVLKRAFL